jgi:hypothetical protein
MFGAPDIYKISTRKTNPQCGVAAVCTGLAGGVSEGMPGGTGASSLHLCVGGVGSGHVPVRPKQWMPGRQQRKVMQCWPKW